MYFGKKTTPTHNPSHRHKRPQKSKEKPKQMSRINSCGIWTRCMPRTGCLSWKEQVLIFCQSYNHLLLNLATTWFPSLVLTQPREAAWPAVPINKGMFMDGANVSPTQTRKEITNAFGFWINKSGKAIKNPAPPNPPAPRPVYYQLRRYNAAKLWTWACCTACAYARRTLGPLFLARLWRLNANAGSLQFLSTNCNASVLK